MLFFLLSGCTIPGCTPPPSPLSLTAIEDGAILIDDQLFLGNPGVGCPTVPGWSGAPLFTGSPGPKLSRYCTYTFPNAGLSDVDSLTSTLTGLGTLGPNRQVVVPAAEADLEAALLPAMAAATRSALGVLGHNGVAGSVVRLAVLDSAPDGDGQPAQYSSPATSHGHTLLNLARSALCPTSTACPVTIHSRQAIELSDHGTWGNLAEKIHSLQSVWVDPTAEGLVINLSLGWSPLHSPSFGSLPVGAQAVYDALRKMQCSGALIIAAAGNRSGGSAGGTGLMMPAAWMEEDVLTPCAELLSAGELALWDAATLEARESSRLLYAVGGAAADRKDLPTSRSPGRPPFVAFGDHALAEDLNKNPTRVLTGTSVSALVVSIAATASWHNRPLPTLQAEGLMTELFASGAPIEPYTTQWAPAVSADPLLARWVDFCSGLTVQGPYDCITAPTSAGPLVPEAAALDSFDLTANETVITVESYIDPSCPGAWRVTGTTPALPCPEASYFSQDALAPWTFTQPPDEGCPVCAIWQLGGTLTLRLAGLDPYPYATLVTRTASGINHYDLSTALELPVSDGWKITLTSASPAPILSARLVTVDAGGVSRILPLSLIRP